MEGALVFWRYRTLFSLILCSLILFKVHSQAAPSQQNADSAVLSKIYPRGSHWAVGHLMGKKSIEEYPYLYDGGERSSATGYSEGDKPMDGPHQWKEGLLSLLKMMESGDSRNSQPMRDAKLYTRKFYDSEDNLNYKEMLDYLYQMMKEHSQS
ncbi:gastrin-releasing peptide [Hyperolius riggenbachi]|uniref:gastrin-releasing peptide n=1 Tax=Hyperolius riggenbachi TaxID=752182 RepID=UPI0035A30ED9